MYDKCAYLRLLTVRVWCHRICAAIAADSNLNQALLKVCDRHKESNDGRLSLAASSAVAALGNMKLSDVGGGAGTLRNSATVLAARRLATLYGT